MSGDDENPDGRGPGNEGEAAGWWSVGKPKTGNGRPKPRQAPESRGGDFFARSRKGDGRGRGE